MSCHTRKNLALERQGRRKVWKSGEACSNVVGIIFTPGWDRVNWSDNIWGGPWHPRLRQPCNGKMQNFYQIRKHSALCGHEQRGSVLFFFGNRIGSCFKQKQSRTNFCTHTTCVCAYGCYPWYYFYTAVVAQCIQYSKLPSGFWFSYMRCLKHNSIIL